MRKDQGWDATASGHGFCFRLIALTAPLDFWSVSTGDAHVNAFQRFWDAFVAGFLLGWLKDGFGKCEMTQRGRHPARNKEAP